MHHRHAFGSYPIWRLVGKDGLALRQRGEKDRSVPGLLHHFHSSSTQSVLQDYYLLVFFHRGDLDVERQLKMRSFVLWIPLCLASGSLAWVETVTEYVTLENSATTSPTSSPSDVRVLAVSQSASTSSSQATFATSFRSSAAESQVSSTSATDSPTTSLIQATSVVSSLPTAAAASSGDYNGGDPGAGSAIDTDAGASGSGSSFSLSRGGMIAIIVVVAIVAIFGS